MERRDFLKAAAAVPLLPLACYPSSSPSTGAAPAGSRWVRPGDPGWPSDAAWNALRREVGGRLIRIESPLEACRADPGGAACEEVFRALKNPYYIGNDPALIQTSPEQPS